MNNNYYDLGSHNIICDICGQKYKSKDCKKQWNNLITCFNCYNSKHPVLEPLPAVIDAKPIKDARPRPNDQNISGHDNGLQIWGQSYLIYPNNLVRNVKWEDWNTRWGDDGILPFNADNFPLV